MSEDLKELRDRFAMAALSRVVMYPTDATQMMATARHCYLQADAMLRVREDSSVSLETLLIMKELQQ